MASRGWEVHVIARPLSEKSPGRYPPETELFRHERLFVHSVAPLKGRPRLAIAAVQTICQNGFMLRGGLHWVQPAVEKALELIRRHKFVALLSRSTPLYAHLAGLAVARKTGLPWFANYADPDARERYPAPYGKGPRERVSLGTRLLACSVSKHADQLTFPSSYLRDYMCSYLPPISRGKASVIPHVALPELAPERTRVPGSDPDELRIIHVGSVKPPRDPRPFLGGLNRFLAESGREGKRISVVFFEHSPALLSEHVRDYGLGDVVEVRDTVTYGEVAMALAEADLASLIEAPMEKGVFLPSKFADYVQAGLPILGLSPVEGSVAALIEKYGGGIAVDGGSSEAIAQGLKLATQRWRNGTLAEMATCSLISCLGPVAVASQLERLVREIGSTKLSEL